MCIAEGQYIHTSQQHGMGKKDKQVTTRFSQSASRSAQFPQRNDGCHRRNCNSPSALQAKSSQGDMVAAGDKELLSIMRTTCMTKHLLERQTSLATVLAGLRPLCRSGPH